MRTAEQIAREVLERHASIHAATLTGKHALMIATKAIEADRAQRVAATSASDRLRGAREALAEYDAKDYMDSATETAENFAELLRELVTPADIIESPKQIAARLYQEARLPLRPTGGAIRDLLATAVHAGIDAAWCSWEPENAPGASS